MFKVNARGLGGITFSGFADADPVGGGATPYFDVVNGIVQGLNIDHIACATGVQPLFQSGSTQTNYSGMIYDSASTCPFFGFDAALGAHFYFRDLGNRKSNIANNINGLTGTSYVVAKEIPAPTVAPVVTVVTTCTGFPAAGNYSYAYVYADSAAIAGNSFHRTKLGPTSNTVTLNGTSQCAQISAPSSPPAGAAFYDVQRMSGTGAGNFIASASLTPIGLPALDQSFAWVAVTAPSVNGAYAHNLDQNGLFGAVSPSAISNNLGDQVFNVTLGSSSPGCATSASVGATCTTANLSLPVAEADTNYRIVCTGKGPTGVPVITSTSNVSSTQFTLTIAALTASAASFASADCRAGHN